MTNYLIGALGIFIIIGMTQQSMRVIKYHTYESQNGREKKITYCMSVPEGGKILTVSGSHEKEIEIMYPDSSFVYITNDAISGSPLNYKNVASVKGVYMDKLLKDTLLLEGIHNGRLWKESKLGKIVIG
jgi:hypothetical protein